MNKIVVTSMRQSAGKTSIIIGLSKVSNKKIGYIKPFGERFLYRKKRLWDYDAALITNIFGLQESPEEMSIGFNHDKLLTMLDERGIKEKLSELTENLGSGKELLLAECGRDIYYGAAVHLDAVTIAGQLDAHLLLIASGKDECLLDDLFFFKRHIAKNGLRSVSVVINKVEDAEEFRQNRLPLLQREGIPVSGVIPYCPELSCLTVSYLIDKLFARILTGEGSVNRPVKTVFVGTMSAEAAQKDPRFLEPHKAVVVSGDRTDLIDAALATGSTVVVVTNNIAPPEDLIEKAHDLKIPLVLVGLDTFETARQIEEFEPLPTANDYDKLELLEQLIKKHVDTNALLRR